MSSIMKCHISGWWLYDRSLIRWQCLALEWTIFAGDIEYYRARDDTGFDTLSDATVCPVKWTINLRPDGLDSLSWGADTRVDSKMFSCLFIITITFSWHFLFHSHQRFLRCATPAGTRCSFVSPQHFLPLLHFTFTFSPFSPNTSFLLCNTNFIFRHPSCSAFHFHF